jgi:signal transduction histidine kinase
MTRGKTGLLRRGTLGRRVLLLSAAQLVLLLAAVVVLLGVTGAARSELERATAGYLEEQGIADRITAAVTLQLVTATAAATGADPRFRAEFEAAGDSAYLAIRRYLFRDLSSEQRAQLESVREQHQRLEVAAARALELAGRGQLTLAQAAAQEMIAHGLTLQEELARFIRLREADLHALAARQAQLFRYVPAGVGVGALLMILAITAMGRFLYHRLAAPMAELARAAERVGAGHLESRVEVPEEPEVRVVASAFNEMTSRLAGARRELEERNRELESALERLWDAQAAMIRSEKLSAMGRIMAGLAHELNNPLTSVLGYGQLAMDRVEAGEELTGREVVEEYVAPVVAEATRARDLVQTLRVFARRPNAAGGGPARVAPAMERAARMRRYAFEQARLELRVGEVPDVAVPLDPARLDQAILHLINNAYDAMTPGCGGALEIRVEVGEGEATLTFEDDGPGFEDVARAFEPFFTTRPVGEGTGLGLPVVHRFVEDAGGKVSAENRPGGGARVVLILPTVAPPVAPPAPDTGQRRETVRSAKAAPAPRILVAEDEAPVRDLQRRLLERMGATVLVAEHAEAARRILEKEEVDLVISDVKMPGGGGAELFDWVLQERPDLADRFLFVTGAAADQSTEVLAEARPELFLHKPFQMKEYLATVGRFLQAYRS